MYRYLGLLHAIEFFSQRFELNAILSYIFEFTSELIVADKMTLVTRKGHELAPLHQKGNHGQYSIHGDQMDQIVYFHAGILNESILKQYFEPDIIDLYNPDITLQLYMDKELYGLLFITFGEKENTDDDIRMAEALMNLYNTALDNYKSYNDLEKTKKLLDEKVFSLFAINQSVSALLSELNKDKLTELAVSVFAELTQSSLTGLFLYDDKMENFQCKGIWDVYKPSHKESFRLYPDLNTPAYKDYANSYKNVINYQDPEQKKSFNSIFQSGVKALESLKPAYIIVLNSGNKILGFVTLGAKVSDKYYVDSEFELIESIVSATFIALENARHLEEVEASKELIRKKFDQLIELNDLMKNINSALCREDLLDLALRTLHVSFGYEVAFMGLVDTTSTLPRLQIIEYQDAKDQLLNHTSSPYLYLQDEYEDFLQGKPMVSYTQKEALDYFMNCGLEINEDAVSGLFMVPVMIHNENNQLLGAIGTTKTKNGLLFDEDKMTVVDAIASHIAPVLYQFNQSFAPKKETNTYVDFFDELREALVEAKEYFIPLYIIAIQHQKNFALDNAIKDASEKLQLVKEVKTYIIDSQNLFGITQSKEIAESININSPLLQTRVLAYSDDFTSEDELITLLGE